MKPLNNMLSYFNALLTGRRIFILNFILKLIRLTSLQVFITYLTHSYSLHLLKTN